MVLLVIYICCGVYPCPGTHTNSPVLSSTLSRSGHGRCHRSSPRGWRLIQPCTTIVKGGDCPQVWCQPPAPPPYFSTIIFQTHNLPIIKCWLPMPMYYPIYPSSHKNITFYLHYASKLYFLPWNSFCNMFALFFSMQWMGMRTKKMQPKVPQNDSMFALFELKLRLLSMV